MQTTANRAVLAFDSNLGEVIRFSIPRASLTTTPAVAETAMNAMIATGAIATRHGFPTEPRGASIVSVQRTNLELA